MKVHPQDTKCTPASARVNFRTVFAWWLRFGGIFTRSLRAMTKKSRQLFLGKSTPPDKILATPMLERHAEKYHILQPKPNTTDELNVALHAIWEELP